MDEGLLDVMNLKNEGILVQEDETELATMADEELWMYTETAKILTIHFQQFLFHLVIFV